MSAVNIQREAFEVGRMKLRLEEGLVASLVRCHVRSVRSCKRNDMMSCPAVLQPHLRGTVKG